MVSVVAVNVPKEICSHVTTVLKSALINGHKAVIPAATPERKLVLLDPHVYPSFDKIPISQFGPNVYLENKEITLTAKRLSFASELKKILPPNVPPISTFSTIGHIAHLNLSYEHLPFKNQIGQLVLDLHSPPISTVVYKKQIINNVHRNFELEVIAGEDNTVTTTKEYQTTYELDLKEVYYNPRLAEEHNRLVSTFRSSEIICDVFAGIGPFAIPAAKKGCLVYANDLNPASVRYMERNAARNKVPENNLVISNTDGKEFLQSVLSTVNPSHIIMNLPDSSFEFLHIFKGLYNNVPKDVPCPINLHWGAMDSPWIHCYKFTRDESTMVKDIIEIGNILEKPLFTFKERHVRNVAPYKQMVLYSFPLSQSMEPDLRVLYARKLPSWW